MSAAEKILVIRFSAMGDAAMTAPVLTEFSEKYPDVELVMLSRALHEPFFTGIHNLQFYTFDPKFKHKGFFGLIRLFRELNMQHITAVADLHNNLRSTVLRILFSIFGVKTKAVDKGRFQKKQLTRQIDKILAPLKLTTERYADVFRSLAFPIDLSHQLKQSPAEISEGLEILTGQIKTQKWIGISPFAQHIQKVYPLLKMEAVVLALANQGFRLFIFGGADGEKEIAESWASKHDNITSTVRQIPIKEELELISLLDLMVSMDSSGMHLASIKGIPVVSIWGSTHPYAGFIGYGQSLNDAVQIDLECRPCSVYGNKPCFRGDFACMNRLAEHDILLKINQKLNEQETYSG